jgi:hypothetical protein
MSMLDEIQQENTIILYAEGQTVGKPKEMCYNEIGVWNDHDAVAIFSRLCHSRVWTLNLQIPLSSLITRAQLHNRDSQLTNPS